MKRTRSTSNLFKEWIKCGKEYHVGQGGSTDLAKYMIVALDPESKEDYPVCAAKMSRVHEIEEDLKVRGQTMLKMVEL